MKALLLSSTALALLLSYWPGPGEMSREAGARARVPMLKAGPRGAGRLLLSYSPGPVAVHSRARCVRQTCGLAVQ